MQKTETQQSDHRLSEPEDALLLEALTGRVPRLLLRSSTRIDTGSWLRRTPLWLCVTQTELLLFAASKRRYLQRNPLIECKGTQYCHTTGSLQLQPTDHWRFKTIALPPTDALKVLEHIERSTEKPTIEDPVKEPTGA